MKIVFSKLRKPSRFHPDNKNFKFVLLKNFSPSFDIRSGSGVLFTYTCHKTIQYLPLVSILPSCATEVWFLHLNLSCITDSISKFHIHSHVQLGDDMRFGAKSSLPGGFFFTWEVLGLNQWATKSLWIWDITRETQLSFLEIADHKWHLHLEKHYEMVWTIQAPSYSHLG